MRTLAILLALFAGIAAGAECPNCHGERIVGPAPVRLPCPVCDGSGEVPTVVVHPPVVLAAEPAHRAAVVRVTAADGNVRHSGSGVLVSVTGSTGVIVTNWHVIRDGKDGVVVRWPNGTTTPAKVKASDTVWDLAALAVANPPASPVPVAVQAPRIGDRLTIAGYGQEGKYLEQAGPVTLYASPGRGRGGPPQLVEMRAAARQGDSGGPMLNADGHVAGVLFGSINGRTIGSCSTRVSAFLAGADAVACSDGRCKTK